MPPFAVVCEILTPPPALPPRYAAAPANSEPQKPAPPPPPPMNDANIFMLPLRIISATIRWNVCLKMSPIALPRSFTDLMAWLQVGSTLLFGEPTQSCQGGRPLLPGRPSSELEQPCRVQTSPADYFGQSRATDTGNPVSVRGPAPARHIQVTRWDVEMDDRPKMHRFRRRLEVDGTVALAVVLQPEGGKYTLDYVDLTKPGHPTGRLRPRETSHETLDGIDDELRKLIRDA